MITATQQKIESIDEIRSTRREFDVEVRCFVRVHNSMSAMKEGYFIEPFLSNEMFLAGSEPVTSGKKLNANEARYPLITSMSSDGENTKEEQFVADQYGERLLIDPCGNTALQVQTIGEVHVRVSPPGADVVEADKECPVISGDAVFPWGRGFRISFLKA